MTGSSAADHTPRIAAHHHAGSVAITVIICSRDRRESLLMTVESLRPQSCSEKWEVLVVDNASADDTALAIAARATSFPVPLRVVTESNAGLSFARNRALSEAFGRIVIFIDDDVTC